MSYADAKLITDLKLEQQLEEAAMQDIYNQMDEDAMKRDKYSLWGSVIGGAIGLFTGGIQGAQIGYNIGKQGKYLAPQDFEISQLEADVFGGGKFGISDMMNWVDEVEWQDAKEDMDEYLETAGDLFSVATNSVWQDEDPFTSMASQS